MTAYVYLFINFILSETLSNCLHYEIIPLEEYNTRTNTENCACLKCYNA